MRRFAVLLVIGFLAVPAVAAARSKGSTAALQVALRSAGTYGGDVDGVMGPGTRRGVRRFQRRNGLTVDGVPGPATKRAMGRRGRPKWGKRVITHGDQGWDVARLQFELARHGFPNGGADGGFGPRTGAALRRFQAWAGLKADGAAGKATRHALARRPPHSPLQFYRPLSVPIGDPFGPRGNTWHPGVDFPAAAGTRVGAAGRGCVTYAGYDPGGYGNLVVIAHRKKVATFYGHMSSIAVSVGQCVVGHDKVGRVGSTGYSTGPHLHFEVRVRGAAVDPAPAFL